MKVLGLHGRMDAGKNFVADKIKDLLERPGVRDIAVADPMKEAIVVLFGVPREDLYSREGKAKLTDWRWEDLGELRQKFPERTGFMAVRDIMQAFGTETMRRLWGATFWTRLLRKTLAARAAENAWELVIVTDIRFQEEAALIHELGGEVWKVIPVDMPLAKILSGETVKAHQQHSSENELPKTVMDETVYNSFRDFRATEVLLKQLLAEFMLADTAVAGHDGFPWPKAHGAYETAGPKQEVIFDKNGHQFLVSPTGDCGSDTGRGKFLVTCRTCQKILHENTTGPESHINGHLQRVKQP